MAARKLWLGLLLLLAAAMLASVACGSSSHVVSAEARSDKPRITNPDVPSGEATQAVQGNNAFAFDLYQELLKSETGNIIFSPYSISTALAMTYAGAQGQTETEMASTLHFLPQDRQHAALNAVDLAIAQAASKTREEDGDPLQLEIVNSLWAQHDYDFAAAFLDTLAMYYGAGVHLARFKEDPEGARDVINAWVSDQTHERIQDLIPPDVIDELTRFVLANTVFFKGSWLFPFDPELTQDGPFHLLNRSDIQTPMMSLKRTLGYAQLDGAQLVRLPYAGGAASMDLIVPDEGTLAAYERGLNVDAMGSLTDALQGTRVELTMPKFAFESQFSLSDALKALGMPAAFDDLHPDFARMNARGSSELFIQAVVHKANITLDELGTEAAAATGVVGGVTSLPPGPVQVNIDRPFIFVIRDTTTGAVLFAGRVVDPSAS